MEITSSEDPKLKNKLPEYMCPIINITDEFPLNNNGKCDKNKLLEEYKNGFYISSKWIWT